MLADPLEEPRRFHRAFPSPDGGAVMDNKRQNRSKYRLKALGCWQMHGLIGRGRLQRCRMRPRGIFVVPVPDSVSIKDEIAERQSIRWFDLCRTIEPVERNTAMASIGCEHRAIGAGTIRVRLASDQYIISTTRR